ncbi:hypothetical protein BCV72DRAFT_302063 [Rhizopus microsporus var. microsporus]|uniref:Uncharacterized protein n=2 Tax=Rhizopus microsporus TaxID=58291 RepID=A0A2G4TA24_RHIZD|nr:uncharacterized protein RHIMIDRAFT_233281 [Rhizopus microsporus ATCC 52813]ORE10291.1 hypothetical protein BCV72DRAFT_302063 [Rhizopus microsporus var. microsporus]PHZ17860.1 hypothetical protein RHIMIDRAFT_233281 [Rhizopus microsporus ATCC 52813]
MFDGEKYLKIIGNDDLNAVLEILARFIRNNGVTLANQKIAENVRFNTNNQMNNRLTVNDEGVQRMVDNNLAVYYSNQMIITQNMTHRPVNTIKAYLAKQEEWKVIRENNFKEKVWKSDYVV